MTKIVIAGKSDCPYFAKAELLADDLQINLPHFSAHKVSVHPESWQDWVLRTKEQHGWTDKHDGSSPLVWRELIDRGGKGMLLGGSNDFEEYVYQTYGLRLDLGTSDVVKTAEENLQYKQTELKEEAERRAQIKPLICTITEGTSPIATCLYPHLINGSTFGKEQDVALRVMDSEEKKSMGDGVIMELEDIASGLCRESKFVSSRSEAFADADIVVLLDSIFADESIEDETERKHNHLSHVKSHFETLGQEIKQHAKRTCKVLVCGQGVPLNYATSVLIDNCCPSLLSQNIVGMANFKEKTAKALLGGKMGVNGSTVHDVFLWGNLSGSYKVDTKWSRVSRLRQTSITGPSWFCRPTSELIYDHKWLEGEFLSKMETRNEELKSVLKHMPWMKMAAAVQETLAAWFLGSEPTFRHNLATYLKEPLYGFEEGSVVCLPVKFFPGSFEIVQDLDVTESAKASKNLAASPSEDSEEADESDGRIEWLEFVSKVSEELREEKELAVGMPVVEKVEKEKTELDQTEVDGEALDETVADDTVVIEKENKEDDAIDGAGDAAETARDPLIEPIAEEKEELEPDKNPENAEATNAEPTDDVDQPAAE
ncbi:putative malate dehydrogenase 1B [Symsagittifera roscoffensis]|uniref:putative malate dehydrogenase 1B n=1 Tax=Symsagittifera roscoffensis TaxID=84072 RepID=UPI00307C2CE2